MPIEAVTGLRERKKQETRERILARARDLFDEKGFADTTIPEIAAAADVSPRTVSSYFPQKEELVFPDKDEMLSALSRALDERPPEEMATDALRRWLIDNFACEGHEDRHDWARALIDTDPDLRAYERVLQERAQEVVATAVAVDLALPPDHHLPQMVAATAMAALDSLGRDETATHDPEQARRLIEDAMHFVGAGVKELRGG
jgi:AcrR family transcriptional regulator